MGQVLRLAFCSHYLSLSSQKSCKMGMILHFTDPIIKSFKNQTLPNISKLIRSRETGFKIQTVWLHVPGFMIVQFCVHTHSHSPTQALTPSYSHTLTYAHTLTHSHSHGLFPHLIKRWQNAETARFSETCSLLDRVILQRANVKWSDHLGTEFHKNGVSETFWNQDLTELRAKIHKIINE